MEEIRTVILRFVCMQNSHKNNEESGNIPCVKNWTDPDTWSDNTHRLTLYDSLVIMRIRLQLL